MFYVELKVWHKDDRPDIYGRYRDFLMLTIQIRTFVQESMADEFFDRFLASRSSDKNVRDNKCARFCIFFLLVGIIERCWFVWPLALLKPANHRLTQGPP